jgi:hypothetical protein
MQAEREDPATLYLFDDLQMPVRPDVVELVKQGRHVCTGVRLLENDKLCLRMVELLMSNWGLKRIARALHVSKHSVRAARDALVARGEIDPLKARVVAVFEDIVEIGAENYLEALEENRVPAAQIPVAVGIFQDKRSLAQGEVTRIGIEAQVRPEPSPLSVERIRDWWRSVRGPVESPSESAQQIPARIG